MKHALVGLATFILVFALIQFLGGAVGCKTILDYGHADGDMLFLSTSVALIVSLMTASLSHIEDMKC